MARCQKHAATRSDGVGQKPIAKGADAMEHTRCLFYGSSSLENILADAIRETEIHLQPATEFLPEQMLNVVSGCILLEVETYATTVRKLIDMFIVQRHSMPIVVLAPDKRANQPGAFSVLASADKPDVIVEAIREAIDRDREASAGIRERMRLLTDREREVTLKFMREDNSKAVAKDLGITSQTVDKHRNQALQKMNSPSIVVLQAETERALLHNLGIDLFGKRRDIGMKCEIPDAHFQASKSIRKR